MISAAQGQSTTATATEKATAVVTPRESDDSVDAKRTALINKLGSAPAICFPSLGSKKKTTVCTASSASSSKGKAVAPTPNYEAVTSTAAPSTASVVVDATTKTPSASKATQKKASSPSKSATTTANGGSKKKSTPSSSSTTVPVDTSTGHIHALTGENGASVCLTLSSCTLDDEEGAKTDTADSKTGSGGGANLTEEERAQQSRDRNRRHARNTRLRKKAYVEELKQTLVELVNERDQALATREHEKQRELETREVRFRVLEEFLKLRGRNEMDANRWSAILADDFSLSLPSTPFQDEVDSFTGNNNHGQTLTGVDQVMEDSRNFSKFLQTLGKSDSGGIVSLVYKCDRMEFMMDDCDAVLAWSARSSGAVSKVSWYFSW